MLMNDKEIMLISAIKPNQKTVIFSTMHIKYTTYIKTKYIEILAVSYTCPIHLPTMYYRIVIHWVIKKFECA